METPDHEAELPAPLAELVREFRDYDRGERTEMLIDFADRFREVPAEVASRPFPEANRAPRCESDAYVWALDRPDGTLDFEFAVENPQGLSAKAWAVILAESLAGQPLERVARVSGDVVFEIFGKDLSMGKGQGLLGMLEVVQHEVRKRLRERATPR